MQVCTFSHLDRATGGSMQARCIDLTTPAAPRKRAGESAMIGAREGRPAGVRPQQHGAPGKRVSRTDKRGTCNAQEDERPQCVARCGSHGTSHGRPRSRPAHGAEPVPCTSRSHQHPHRRQSPRVCPLRAPTLPHPRSSPHRLAPRGIVCISRGHRDASGAKLFTWLK